MKVLQVALSVVYPPSSGGDHRTHGLVYSLPSLGNEVIRFCQGGLLTNHGLSGIQRWVQIDSNYRECRPANPFHDAPSLLQLIFDSPGYFSQKWLELSFPEPLAELIDWADVVLVEYPFQIPPIVEHSTETPVIYSSHNVESERLRSRSRILTDQYNLYLDSVEQTAVQATSAVICTSEADYQKINKKFGSPQHAVVAPNGIYKSEIRDSRDASGTGVRNTLGIDDNSLIGVFVGSDYGPNREAAQALVDIANQTDSSRSFDIIIVGSVCDSVISRADAVHTVGFVEDIEPYYDVADYGLNPMRSGGGSNIKLVEYMAKALPVISTPFGARGFEAEHGTDLLIAEIENFMEIMLNTEPATRYRIGGNAMEVVSQKYIWRKISENLNQKLKKIIE